MDDPVKTLLALLYDNWTLTDELDAESVAFRTEEPLKPDTRFVTKNISIEIKGVASGATPKNTQRTVFREIVSIDVWVRLTPATEEGKETALDNKRALIEHIRSIIKAHAHRESGIDFKYFGGDKTLNGLGEEPPFLRSIVNVVCIYNV